MFPASCVAETASSHRYTLFIGQRNAILGGHRRKGTLHFLPRAGATVFRLVGVENVVLHTIQRQGTNLLGSHPLPQHGGDGGEFAHVGLNLINDVLGAERQQLQQQTAGGLHRQIGVNQHTQGTDGGSLLAGGVVAGDVLGNLAGNQRRTAHVGFGGTGVTEHPQLTVGTYGTADVQFAIGFEGNLHDGVLGVATDVTAAVRHRHHGACRTAACQLEGQAVVLALHHHAHHRGGRQQTTQGGGNHRRGLVDVLGTGHHIGGIQE